MNTSIQNCMVAQSGGPTVAINASLAGVIKGAAGCYSTVYGSVNGILGILNEHYLNLSEIMEADDNALDRLIQHRQCTLVPAVLSCRILWMMILLITIFSSSLKS